MLPMRILLWHGYLLGGTGSNVYSRALAREWSRGGHEVVVVSQERAPEQYDLGGAQAVAVDLPGRLLPVFVMDRYEGLEPKLLQDFSEAERRAYVEANAAALRALLPALRRLLTDAGCHVSDTDVVVQNGRVLKSGYEEGYFRRKPEQRAVK